jgi:hypothetical protein
MNCTGKAFGTVKPKVKPLKSVGVGIGSNFKADIAVLVSVNNLNITAIEIGGDFHKVIFFIRLQGNTF